MVGTSDDGLSSDDDETLAVATPVVSTKRARLLAECHYWLSDYWEPDNSDMPKMTLHSLGPSGEQIPGHFSSSHR
jgi:hypothetical protein